MQFTSVPYLAFLAIAVIVYFVLPGPRTRAVWLLALSGSFYVLLSPDWFWVLILVTAFTYIMGFIIGASRARRGSGSPQFRDRIVFVGSICVVAGALIVFKYLGFFAETGNGLLNLASVELSLPVVRLLLPIGISFWTFQAIAYLVDVYRGTTEPERNPLYYALAVMFFPIVTVGPITRVQALVQQLRQKHRFDYRGMQSGLLLIGRGFFKKLMVADVLAVFVNTVFNDPHRYRGSFDGLIFTVAAVFFAVQLYCDFSGYTDIVRGSARLFGVELPINFRAPYFSRDVKEFWRRWHITLMDWLRNYVYFPLGGNRKGAVRRDFNVMTVFLISGLWHGAGLNFIAWGALNGMYQIVGERLMPLRDRIVALLGIDRATMGHRIFQTLFTFTLITFSWVFFRANSLDDAIYMATRMFLPTVWIFTDGTMAKQGLTYLELSIALLSAGAVFTLDWLSLRTDLLASLNRQHLFVRWTVYYGLILVVVVFGRYGGTYNAADFVYFKF